jgi:hypothetical protein
VATVVSPTSFKVYVDDAPTGTLTATSAKIYVRPQATFGHRPHDGGVIFSANGNSNNQQAIRQTRRYFRYQSGKGIQYSSGSLLKPSYQLDELSCNDDVITIQTKESHNLLPGAEINIINAEPVAYNGTYTVDTVLSHNKFQVTTTEPLPDRASAGSGSSSITTNDTDEIVHVRNVLQEWLISVLLFPGAQPTTRLLSSGTNLGLLTST